MGLLNELNTINRTLENNNKIITKQQKEEEKAKNKIYIAKIEMLDDLKEENNLYLKYNHNIFSQKIRNEIIDALLEYSNIIYNKNYTKAFLIENYEKEAKKLYKLYEHNKKEEARQEEIKQRAQSKEWIQKQKQKQIFFNNTMIFLKTLTLILLSPFLLIIFFVFGICKNIK